MASNRIRVSASIKLKNLDKVGYEARQSFSRIAWKTESKVSSSAQSSWKYAEIIW